MRYVETFKEFHELFRKLVLGELFSKISGNIFWPFFEIFVFKPKVKVAGNGYCVVFRGSVDGSESDCI